MYSMKRKGIPPKWSPWRCETRTKSMRPVSWPPDFKDCRIVGPQSSRNVAPALSTRYALCQRPPDPKASPDPSTVTLTSAPPLSARTAMNVVSSPRRPRHRRRGVPRSMVLACPLLSLSLMRPDPELLHEAARVAQVVLVAAAAGSAAERIMRPGLAIRGLSLLAGLAGLYAGGWFWDV